MPYNSNKIYLLFILLVFHRKTDVLAANCGCKEVRDCYETMWEQLHDRDEVYCIEDASMAAITITIFLKALSQFCPNITQLHTSHETYLLKSLYEVVINIPLRDEKAEAEKPVILIDAGQQAGEDSVRFALYIIQQLVACLENRDMIMKVKWVILPSVNPDGMEISKYINDYNWQRNCRSEKGKMFKGIDISRNFGNKFDTCDKVRELSPIYPGNKPFSENETIFVKDMLEKYKKNLKAYVSIRRDGHSLSYPYAYDDTKASNIERLQKAAGSIAIKINQKAGGVQIFVNDSIFNVNGKKHCGHSVDYAYDMEIPLCFEMRVYIGKDLDTILKFQKLPPGFDSSLTTGYFNGIKELYQVITDPEKYGITF